jgi:hypothetical protein
MQHRVSKWDACFWKPRRRKITSWIRLFLRKLKVPHLFNKFLTQCESRNIINMLTYMCPELVLILSKMFTVHAVPLDFFKTPVSLLLKYAYVFKRSCVPHSLPVLSSLILSLEQYLTRNANHEASH